MNDIVRILTDKKYIFSLLNEIDKKNLKVRKKVRIFIGVDLKNYYTLIIQSNQKSRFLISNIDSLEGILDSAKKYLGYNIKKYIFLNSGEMCSKAKKELIKKKWKVIK
jgi:hypothetical protein